MLALIVQRGFVPSRFCSDLDQLPDHDSFLMSRFSPKDKSSTRLDVLGFSAQLIESFPVLVLCLALSFVLPPLNIICMLVKGVCFPLWAGISSGVKLPLQPHGCHFPSDTTAFWMCFHGMLSRKHPGSGTNTTSPLISLCQTFFPVTSNAPHTFWGLTLFSCQRHKVQAHGDIGYSCVHVVIQGLNIHEQTWNLPTEDQKTQVDSFE